VAAPATPAVDYALLNVSSAAGWAAVPFLPGADWVGWALPLVGRTGPYNLSFVGFGGDVGDVRLRWSEVIYSPPGSPEWATVAVTGPAPRFATAVTYDGDGSPRAPAAARALAPASDLLGTGVASGAGNVTWTVLLNSVGLNYSLPATALQVDAAPV